MSRRKASLVIGRLGPDQVGRLQGEPLTYPEVGATAGPLPPGYHHLSRSHQLGRGAELWSTAGTAVLRWALPDGTGLAPLVSDDTAVAGSVAVLRLGRSPLVIRAPVRVVRVASEPTRRGFAYGTLPGHPEQGEESFVVRLADDETVWLDIVAFSRPGSLITRAAGPVGRLGQRWMTWRYLRVLDRSG